MTYNTINDAVTMAGGEGTLLANRYRVVRQLGQGGMGSVWLAEDTQLDNKQFAVKMLPSILVSNKRAYRQLKDEALVAMKLTHSNIVTLRAFEENSGNPFLVMDYIDGQTLDDYLSEKGKLSEGEAVKLLKPIAAALDYAHGEGVVHRDVKPANVMIRKDGHPYILDFGIAREIQETMTRVTGKLSSGTLLYMSPEQLRGQPPSSAQDVYSFAAMAYECIKGEPPFTRGAIEDQIKNEPPSPLPEGACAASIMSGLAKKPEDRPATCAAVLGGSASGNGETPSVDVAAAVSSAMRICRRASERIKPVVVRCAKAAWSVARIFPRKVAHMKLRTAGAIVAGVIVLFGVFCWLSRDSLKNGETRAIELPGGATMEMIYVEPGSFMMGSPTSEDGRGDNETQHRVTLTKGFWLGKYEVTQKQWQSVMGDNPSEFKSPDRPVESVSWEDCQKFIAKVDAEARRQLGGEARLPTEAEWEYACRAGTTTAYFWGSSLNGDKANCDGNYPCDTTVKGPYREKTAPVGSYAANPWGFFDMHGNVYEWCSDWYGVNYYKSSPSADPQGPASGDIRVLRGGCWYDSARLCRSANRCRYYPGYRNSFYGFRLCCSEGPRK